MQTRSRAVVLIAMLCIANLLGILGCSNAIEPTDDTIVLPNDYPLLSFPADNPPNAERIALGKRLFADVRLSRDNDVSCSSCHNQELAFSDGRQVSIGTRARRTDRNSPSIQYAGFEQSLMREGTVPSLEMQVLVPFQEHAEFDLHILDAVEKIGKDSTIILASQSAFGRDPDAYVITRAIASYVRSLPTFSSLFDDAVRSGSMEHLSMAARRGYRVFFSSKAQCSTCHAGLLFRANMRIRHPAARTESGFKIPGLRNVARTAPYLFDGSSKTLSDVVRGYKNHSHLHLASMPTELHIQLSDSDCDDLVEFLKTLSDRQ